MESNSVNQTNSGDNSTLSFPVEGLVAYYLGSLTVTVPVIFFHVLILLTFLVDRSTVGIIRLVLCNISVACVVVAVSTLVYDVAGLALAFTDTEIPENVIQLCKATLVGVVAGGAARFLFLAVFSATVYYIVRFRMSGKTDSNRRAFIACAIVVVLLWGLAILYSLLVLFDFLLSDSCRYTAIGGIVNVVLYILIFGIGGFATSIMFLLLTAFYIYKHTISDANHHYPFQKALVKLGFFLLCGGFVNFIGQIVPLIVSAVVSEERETLEVSLVSRYSVSILIDLSLIPAPILLIIYFKPIRMHLKKWLCCYCGRETEQTLAEGKDKKNAAMGNMDLQCHSTVQVTSSLAAVNS